jgi:L-histidine N-alpha-methyltransferase
MNFAEDVRAGLTDPHKHLPSKYFYDALGSALFEAICDLPEYYLTRAETEILSYNAQAIVDAVGTPLELVELGSGSAIKTRLLIDAVFTRQAQLRYRPIDISKAALDASARSLQHEYPGIVVDGVNADYASGLRLLSRNGSRCTLALFLGSNIGNFNPVEAERTLGMLRSVLEPGDCFLLGADLKKDRRALELAYDDPTGVTAAFNLNLLGRINRELGGEFDLKQFRHRAFYNEEQGRVESHLVSLRRQDVPIKDVGIVAHFEEGETIHTESSYKFDTQSIGRLANATGFDVRATWTDPAHRFADFLLVAN